MPLLLRALGIALLSLAIIFVLRGMGGGFEGFVKASACVLLFSFAGVELARGIDAIKDIYLGIRLENAFLGEALGVMIKALAIALVGRIGADICKECGESGLAQGIETVSGVIIFSLSLPVLSQILTFASDVLQKGG